MIKFAVLCLLFHIASSTSLDDEEFQRDIRQAPVFFSNGLAPQRGQPIKGQTPIPRFSTFGGAPPQAFRTAPPPVGEEEQDEESDEVERNSIAPSQVSLPPQQVLHFRQQSQTPPPQHIQFRPTSPIPTLIQQPAASAQVLQPQQTFVLKPRPPTGQEQQQLLRRLIPQNGKGQLPNQSLSEEELEEKEEPDRLTELLPQSKFSCNSKKTGYYADDGLNCEVFHYCQDNARYSWICPEGFSFHQVHLICMPPSSDNICQQSSQFHFVNDFLYRPVNAEEAQSRPNVTLKYADRYYPETYYETYRDDENGERTFQQRQPIVQASSVYPKSKPTPAPQQFPSTLRPLAQLPQHFSRQPQVFHSTEEVNIPYQVRRPIGSSPPPPSNALHQRPQNDFDFERK